MKLVTYRKSAQAPTRVGLRLAEPATNDPGGFVVDFQEGFELIKSQGHAPSSVSETSYTDMIAFIRDQEQTLPAARAVLVAFREKRLPENLITQETNIEILSPIPRPTSMRDAYAFRQHVEAARRNRGVPMIPEFDHFPVFYFTNHLAVTGPGPIAFQETSLEKLDFELEYAIVIGKEGRNIPVARADEHVFGYCIMNDWSARAEQMREMKLNLGPAKGKDFCTSLGPYLVPRSELENTLVPGENGERHDLSMKAWVNGIQVSEGNTKDISWTFAQIIERASYGVTLYPGDVIGSGTVGTGCFLELNGSKITDNQWLKPGDEMILEVAELGRLINKVEKA